ncbi:hypothetical protein Cgig2_010303 [Carnegiea gigantea]|uniref:Uncharacterized protein n=1 Tax=Carnegiea gigantea TaxID=171969 RepID=A0A9Q1KHY5_9CARY|nr:hypothetical protein Cgig2_010303 [Carnegiea gigantea]
MTNTLGKILKDQKAGRGEKEILIQRLRITRLALPPLGALHELNCLSYKLGDGPRPVIPTYVKLEVTGHLSLLSRSSFTVASASGIMKRVGAPGNSSPSATISVTNPSGARPFLLSTDLPGADGPSGDEELVDGPSNYELLDERSEEELEEIPSRPLWPLVGMSMELNRDYLVYPPLAARICHLHLWTEDTRGEEYSQLDHEGVPSSKRGTLGLRGRSIQIPPGHLGNHRPLLHQPTAEAGLP